MTRASRKQADDVVITGDVLPAHDASISVDPENRFSDLGSFVWPSRPDGAVSNAGRTEAGAVRPHQRSEATAGIVSLLVACGASVADIAVHLDIRPGQLKACYRHELESGAFPHDMQVAKAILDRAKLGDPRFSLFWAKARMGWKENDDGIKAVNDDESMTLNSAQLKKLVRGGGNGRVPSSESAEGEQP